MCTLCWHDMSHFVELVVYHIGNMRSSLVSIFFSCEIKRSRKFVFKKREIEWLKRPVWVVLLDGESISWGRLLHCVTLSRQLCPMIITTCFVMENNSQSSTYSLFSIISSHLSYVGNILYLLPFFFAHLCFLICFFYMSSTRRKYATWFP